MHSIKLKPARAPLTNSTIFRLQGCAALDFESRALNSLGFHVGAERSQTKITGGEHRLRLSQSSLPRPKAEPPGARIRYLLINRSKDNPIEMGMMEMSEFLLCRIRMPRRLGTHRSLQKAQREGPLRRKTGAGGDRPTCAHQMTRLCETRIVTSCWVF